MTCPANWVCMTAIGLVALQLIACALIVIVGWMRVRRYDEYEDFE